MIFLHFQPEISSSQLPVANLLTKGLVQAYISGSLSGGGGGGHFLPPPPLDMLRILSIQAFTINGKLCLCENSPRFHQIASNKIKISRGACPRTPLLCHMLCTRILNCPPNNSHNLILPPLGQKAERNPAHVHPLVGIEGII